MARDYTKPNSKTVAIPDLYSDLDITFERHPVTNDVVLKKDSDAIKRSLKNILLTNDFERPFKPNFGANLRTRLFELGGNEIGHRVGRSIIKDISILEPRVSNVQLSINDSAYDRNELNITIFYDIKNGQSQQQFDFTVSRVR
tara:strand:+ start:6112 stop:6540 length:429 start_codon:yes stop_codon:yes gene_type:complete